MDKISTGFSTSTRIEASVLTDLRRDAISGISGMKRSLESVAGTLLPVAAGGIGGVAGAKVLSWLTGEFKEPHIKLQFEDQAGEYFKVSDVQSPEEQKRLGAKGPVLFVRAKIYNTGRSTALNCKGRWGRTVNLNDGHDLGNLRAPLQWLSGLDNNNDIDVDIGRGEKASDLLGLFYIPWSAKNEFSIDVDSNAFEPLGVKLKGYTGRRYAAELTIWSQNAEEHTYTLVITRPGKEEIDRMSSESASFKKCVSVNILKGDIKKNFKL